MRSWLLAVLLLAGCNSGSLPDDDTDTSPEAVATSAALSPGTTPVRIGEQGPSFAACGIGGIVIAASAPVRAAPFEEAALTDTLEQGRPLFVCTRSIDQSWLGIVVPAADAPQDGCDVTTPVPSRRGYDGPCRSGWVPAATIRARAR
jgi:hypothetical protein